MATQYHIRLKGHLDDHWSAWFDNMTISNEANGEAVLRGPLPDQAALHGVLIKIRDLGLPLLAVTTVATDETQNNHIMKGKTAMNTITSIVKRHPLVTFFVLAYAISYGFYLLSAIWPGSRSCSHLAR